jgi:hypothetical protein
METIRKMKRRMGEKKEGGSGGDKKDGGGEKKDGGEKKKGGGNDDKKGGNELAELPSCSYSYVSSPS